MGAHYYETASFDMKKNLYRTTIHALSIRIWAVCIALPLWSVAQTVIGGENRDTSAVLDLQSNQKGFLLPRLTQGQRDAIPAPAMGLMIFNTSKQCIEVNIGVPTTPAWRCLSFQTPFVLDSLNCAGKTVSGTLTASFPAVDVEVTIPYESGASVAYEGRAFSAAGVTGLQAVLSPGIFTAGTGSLIFGITGTPSGTGTAVFTVSVAGRSCVFSLQVE
jgi:hypothetical protein